MKNYLKTVMLLSVAAFTGIASGQDARPTDDSVITAVEQGDLEELKDLLKRGGNVNATRLVYQGDWDTSVLEIAAIHASPEIVRELLKQPYLWQSSKDAALYEVARQDRPKMQEIAKDLIQAGANVDLTDNDGASLLMKVAQEYLKSKKDRKEVLAEIITNLIISGANLHVQDKKGKRLEDYLKKSHALRKIVEDAQKQKIAGKKL